MGGDKLMPEVAGITADSPLGGQIADRRREIFESKYLPDIRPFPGARELVAAIKARGLAAVAASSAKKDELRALLRIAGAESLLDAATSSDDVKESKPDPDIILAALGKAHAEPTNAVLIGDTPYDVEAAGRAGVDCIAFRCGGWQDRNLHGAIAVYDGPWELLAHL
jgi:HAD superfamily hydrolase (TIGR01509 family)